MYWELAIWSAASSFAPADETRAASTSAVPPDAFARVHATSQPFAAPAATAGSRSSDTDVAIAIGVASKTVPLLLIRTAWISPADCQTTRCALPFQAATTRGSTGLVGGNSTPVASVNAGSRTVPAGVIRVARRFPVVPLPVRSNHATR